MLEVRIVVSYKGNVITGMEHRETSGILFILYLSWNSIYSLSYWYWLQGAILQKCVELHIYDFIPSWICVLLQSKVYNRRVHFFIYKTFRLLPVVPFFLYSCHSDRCKKIFNLIDIQKDQFLFIFILILVRLGILLYIY